MEREFRPRATVYRAREGDNVIEVTLRDEICPAGRAGAHLEKLTSVSVRLNDRRFDGCGHATR